MPEVSDPTLISEYDVVIAEQSSATFEKKNTTRNQSYLVMREGAAEGGAGNWGEVVTR